MKYLIQRNLEPSNPLLYSVTDPDGNLCYRIEQAVNNLNKKIEFNICYGNFESAGSVYAESLNSGTEIMPTHRCTANLGGFRADVCEQHSMFGNNYSAANSPYRAEGLLDTFFWLYAGKLEIVKMRRKIFSLGKYIVTIKDQSVPRDSVFAVFFGMLAIFEQESYESHNRRR